MDLYQQAVLCITQETAVFAFEVPLFNGQTQILTVPRQDLDLTDGVCISTPMMELALR